MNVPIHQVPTSVNALMDTHYSQTVTLALVSPKQKEEMSVIYLVCSNTMCVSTCQVDCVLLGTCIALYSTIARQIFGFRETSQF